MFDLYNSLAILASTHPKRNPGKGRLVDNHLLRSDSTC